MIEELILRAAILAEKAHRGQQRDAGEPYVIHPLDVGLRLAEAQAPGYVIAAGILHDVKEDTAYGKRILMDFGSLVDDLVTEVSNVYTATSYRGWSRDKRKDAEAARLRNISAYGKSIKLADIGSNASTIDGVETSWRQPYLKELRFLLERIKEGGSCDGGINAYLYKKAWKTVNLALLQPA